MPATLPLTKGSDVEATVAPTSREREAAIEVLLLLADADARWWDYASAVRLLHAAAEAAGELPMEYELKRARWVRLRDVRSGRRQAWSRRAA
jgi:hypothetical protein